MPCHFVFSQGFWQRPLPTQRLRRQSAHLLKRKLGVGQYAWAAASFVVITVSAATGGVTALPWEGGAELELDGVDDFFAAFPTFSMLSNWTVEAWVKPEQARLGSRQCLLHLSTYSGANLLTLEADHQGWRITYGDHDIATGAEAVGTPGVGVLASNYDAILGAGVSLGPLTPNEQHVALAHSMGSSSEAQLALYLDATLAVTVKLEPPEIVDQPMWFLVGACSDRVANGVVRSRHFGGHVDELRHWAVARTEAQVVAAMTYTGLPGEWPASLLVGGGPEAQYTFDVMTEPAVFDASGRGNGGLLGGGVTLRERPRYRRSVFGMLRLGAQYRELWLQPSSDGGNVTCPSPSCLDLSGLLLNGAVNYNALLLRRVPGSAGVYLTTEEDQGTRLQDGELLPLTDASMVLTIHTEQVTSYDTFEFQPCRGLSSETPAVARCAAEKVFSFTLRVLEPQRPTAGEAYSLQLFGADGYLQLREQLPQSATVEFWTQLVDLDGRQALFSVSHAATGRPLIALSLEGGEVVFYLCSELSPASGTPSFRMAVPELTNVERQHIAIRWDYLVTTRGLPTYRVTIFRNCQPVATMPVIVKDVCYAFGLESTRLSLATFGQQYRPGSGGAAAGAGDRRRGLRPGAFARMHLADVRVWERGLEGHELCGGSSALLRGDEAGLRAAFRPSVADQRRIAGGEAAAVLLNLVPGGPLADLRCEGLRLACPGPQRGYALRPSVFALEPEPLRVETSAGRAWGPAGPVFLDPLRLDLHVFDRDNYVGGGLESSSLDSVHVRLTALPDPRCGVLLHSDLKQEIAAAHLDVSTWELPLYFRPTRPPSADADALACNTALRYLAVDSLGLESPFNMTLEIVVKVMGPRVGSVEIFDAGLADAGLDAGDVLKVNFDKPTERPDWRGLFEVVDGSLGQAVLKATWNDGGEALSLELLGPADGLNITPGLTRLRFGAGLAATLRTAGGDSYPCSDLSPSVSGSFAEATCLSGRIFNASLPGCQACAAGTRIAADGRSCLLCGAGLFVPFEAALACVPCAEGRFQPRASLNRSQCARAAAGRYVAGTGEIRDLDCPAGSVAEVSGSGACTACPAGADCMWAPPKGKSLARKLAAPKPGYFRTVAGRIVQCAVGPACLGWDSTADRNLCASRSGGYLCQACLEGSWRPHDQPRALCSDCSWVSWLGMLVVIGLESLFVWLMAVMSVNAAVWGGMHAVTLRLMLNYVTAASVAARLEDWEFEPYLGADYAAAASTLLKVMFRLGGGIPVQYMGLECLMAKLDRGDMASPREWALLKGQTLFWAFAPLVWSSMLMLFGVFAVKCYSVSADVQRAIGGGNVPRGRGDIPEDLQPRALGIFRAATLRAPFCRQIRMALGDTVPLAVAAMFVCLPTVLRELVAVLACERFEDGFRAEWQLLAAPEVVCWEGDHTAYAVFAILALVLWGAIVPLVTATFLGLKRVELSTSTRFRVTWGFVSDGYEPRFAFWEGVVQLRRLLLIVVVGVWPGLSRPAELALYQMIGTLALAIHLSGKPFDNRAGELLDTIEQNGLMLFLLLVSAPQLILLARPGAQHDLLPASLTLALGVFCILIFAALRAIGRYVAVVALVALLVFVVGIWTAEGDSYRRAGAFFLIAVAVLLNVAFMVWLWFKMLVEAHRAIAASINRARGAAENRVGGAGKAVTRGMLLAFNTRHMLASTTPGGSLTPRPVLPELRKDSMLSGIRGALVHSQSMMEGALIRFNAERKDLVLGLHPETYMNDAHLSAYARRELASLGPFLKDEERDFVAMSFKDALIHIIDVCDVNPVSCNLLECLVRTAFVWRYQKQRDSATDEGGGGSDGKAGARTLTTTRARPKRPEPPTFASLLFQDAPYKEGMTAADFQTELQRITTMSAAEVRVLLNDFRDASAAQPIRWAV